jgi:hypothetical protein
MKHCGKNILNYIPTMVYRMLHNLMILESNGKIPSTCRCKPT